MRFKFIATYFILFDDVASGVVLISFLDYLLLEYRNITNSYVDLVSCSFAELMFYL